MQEMHGCPVDDGGDADVIARQGFETAPAGVDCNSGQAIGSYVTAGARDDQLHKCSSRLPVRPEESLLGLKKSTRFAEARNQADRAGHDMIASLSTGTA